MVNNDLIMIISDQQWLIHRYGEFPARHGGSPLSLDGFWKRENPIVRNGSELGVPL